jgi:hypothetical protein
MTLEFILEFKEDGSVPLGFGDRILEESDEQISTP